MEQKLNLIDTLNFESPISIDNGYANHLIAENAKSEMRLYNWGDPGHYKIEWDVSELGEGAHIGIWHEDKRVTDYDGVFELPLQAIQLLEKNGFNCEDVKP
jgi:hypothetical protein